MIEHYGVVASGYADVHTMVKQKNLGALILWNPDNADGTVARQMSAAYAASAKASHHPELFIAADQEEKGTQRFKSRHGFTDLVEGDRLGAIVAREGDAEVCDLHARITSTEMASVGLNMTLGTVSDVYTHDSGTPGMFRTRAISSDPKIITSCVQAMTKAYGEEGHVVFITKHFPGLGNASGNTDVDPSVHTYSNTKDKVESELSPYRRRDRLGEQRRHGSALRRDDQSRDLPDPRRDQLPRHAVGGRSSPSFFAAPPPRRSRTASTSRTRRSPSPAWGSRA